MRTLLLLRGVPASGKSSFIKENKLEPYTLATDDIRLQLRSPILTENGYTISQKLNKRTWETLYQLIENKMQVGDFIVVDATHCNVDRFRRYKNLADKYKYKIYYKQFDTPIEECIKRNNERDEYKRVPLEVIKRMDEDIKKEPPTYLNKIESLSDIDNFFVKDLSNYDNLIIVGDIHGCINPLKELLNKFDINDNRNAYVFLGDYIDRGLNNKEVMEIMLKVYKQENVFCLEGNHEDSLLNLASGIESKKQRFEECTRPQLEDLDKKEIKRFYKRLRQCMKIKFKENKFIMTHGGLPYNPQQLTLVSTQQLIKGVGDYGTEIDKIYTSNKSINNGFIQVHGHRNTEETDYFDSDRQSISLEGGVEFGGQLKVLVVNEKGIQLLNIQNDKFDNSLFETTFLSKTTTDNPEVNKLMRNRFIRPKTISGNIMSLNFSRSAFRKHIWDSMTTKARGLFVDKETGKVVARSYDKFFNEDEVEWTKVDNLKTTLVPPLKCWKKENGYLGIVSHRDGELAFYSKSTNESEHAKWLKELFLKQCNGKEEDILNIILDKDISLVFEVIKTKEDPHIIEYKEDSLFLLDTFKNSLETVKDFGLEEIKSVLQETKIKYKELLKTFESTDDLFNYIDSQRPNEKIEGLVVEDSKGFLFKVKYDFYKKWKYYRSLTQRKNIPAKNEFMVWYKDNVNSLEGLNIIELRKRFEKPLTK